MKPLLLASFAVAALPLLAGETQTQTQSAPAPAPAPAATTTAAPAVPDSPLVAAAKAAQAKQAKKRKATIVITNDTLIKSGGHITTANTPAAALPPVPPHVSEEEMRAEQAKRAADAKAAADRTAAEQKERDARAAMIRSKLEESGATLYDDPAMSEHLQEEAAKPKAAEEKKPPR
ncbi:MAG TPA: hypothetical protein VG323_09060 [Thermoanaerobaculia bacterium]|nr:hypothetical protein [Thermoanaerobaculia bacterium]